MARQEDQSRDGGAVSWWRDGVWSGQQYRNLPRWARNILRAIWLAQAAYWVMLECTASAVIGS